MGILGLFNQLFKRWGMTLKRWTLVIFIVLVIGYLGFQYLEHRQQQLQLYDTSIMEYIETNGNVQTLMQEAIGGTHYDIKRVNDDIDRVKALLQSRIDDMEKAPVPKSYQQAHRDLLISYKNFSKKLTTYQKNLKKDGMITKSNILVLNSAYSQLIQASDHWYVIFKESLKNEGRSFPIFGSLQHQRFYENETQTRMEIVLTGVEHDIIPFVNQKDYGALDKMLSNTSVYLWVISYMTHMNVPEAYTFAHQHLLTAYINYYTLVKDVQYPLMDEEFLEKVKGCYQDMKQASEEWNEVYDHNHINY
ncbi:hypothetical protein PH210_27655 [Paenibacillus sp. BSR1-1]|uniref:hypothetical protein n=1 Tax=Paenibacillus sp. BSR1-1 TaxID=3020845 RepID=UPI0025AF53B9|nr:hypothetical protein [Paenibacillus sp. BSR1-1]MDN3019922.1 hypothetical protein [Paenibacillus sp. BSR1-1]